MPDAKVKGKAYPVRVKNDRMELIEDNGTEGVIIGDLWGYISDVNQALVNMYGAKDKSEFIGKHVVEFLVKEEKSRAVQNSLNTVANGQPDKQVYRVRLKDGREVDMQVDIDFVLNEEGEKVGFIDIIKIIPQA